MNQKKLPIGISDFKDVVTGDYCYVDKTLFIKDILDKGDKLLLIPRPRRFGKTLNLSMLKYFYDCCPSPLAPTAKVDNKELFQSLAISQAGDKYLEKMGRFPVIFLSFKSVKELEWGSCLEKIKRLIQDEYVKHSYLLDSPVLKPVEKEFFQRVLHLKGTKSDFESSLEKLLVFLSRHYGERGVILIDEYDAPVHAGFHKGFYEEVINFMRNFLGGGLKDTDQFLEKGIITGIMRVARESIFSGLNNLGVYTLVSEEFDDKFGFTEEEVNSLLKEFLRLDMYHEVRQWYNGYRFGNHVIYNPWSIINFLGSKGKELEPYWINTSDNEIVETLLSKGGKELKDELELLIRGDSIEKVIEKNITLKHIPDRENVLWSFLLMGGYLKQTSKRLNPTTGKMFYGLAIPNMEVKTIYIGIVDHFFRGKVGNRELETMLKALMDGDIKLFEKMLRKVVASVFSYHDFGNEPEKVYHALVAGLLVWISDTHEIKSNRESGYGRYDIMIIPKDSDRTGYVMEFKTVDTEEKETVDKALDSALNQMNEKQYEAELVQRGIKDIKKLAVAFKGKEVFVRV